MLTYKIQARASGQFPKTSVIVMYGTDWEDCDGTNSLTLEECSELIRDWMRDDRKTAREVLGSIKGFPHKYRITAV